MTSRLSHSINPFFCLLIAVVLLTGSAASHASPQDEVDHEQVTIWSEGIRLAGDIYRPKRMQAGERLPGLLLVHGWGGGKQHLNRAYAPQFANLGFVVLTFDYKSWGESNGPLFYREALPAAEELTLVNVEAEHIRRIINPRSIVEDARAALNYLAGEPGVQPNNLGIWGTSLGGGVALVTAARDSRIKAYVDQVGAVNFRANLKMITDEMVTRWEIQRARGDIASYPGAESVIDPALKGYPDWIYLKRFDSFASAEHLNVPTLIIDAEDEDLFAREVNGALLHDTIKDRVESKYVVIPGKHYDIYRGEPYRKALAEAQDWFVKHLKGSTEGAALYQENCASCHSNPIAKASTFSTLRAMGYEELLGSMRDGSMSEQSAGMNDAQREKLARYLSEGSVDPRAWEVAVACDSAGKDNTGDLVPSVTGWGYGTDNRRFQGLEAAGLGAKDLPDLEVAWAQGFPGATTMRSQPVITDDTLFIGVAATRSVYAFDLESGCLKWAYRSTGPVRSALGYGLMPGSQQPILFFGDAKGNVHVLNARDGSEVWSVYAGLHSASTITGTPVLHDDRLYVPISSFEVARAGMANYECCREHGGVRALSIRTGEVLWTYATTPDAKTTGKTVIGTKTWGPAGAPVWTTPAIDAKRNRLYVGTGQNYSSPATETSDAIIALDLDSGEPAWIYQATENDIYTEACIGRYLGYPDNPNCPEDSGPDFDFGASVVITRSAAGRDILLAGQKSGDVYALDPDQGGAVIWHKKLSDGTPVGGVHWGMSVEGDTVFVPVADPEWNITGWDYTPRPGLTALDVSTGTVKWRYEIERGCELDPGKIDMKNGRQDEDWPDCPYFYGYSAALTGIEGAVLAGSLNGTLQALSSDNGRELWRFDTKKSFPTLNGVQAHGGALDNPGPAVGGGYMVLQSGYAYFNQMRGNLLLVLKKPD
jgi:polyvinyl alcohol dehydrogenase (cytochrome)